MFKDLTAGIIIWLLLGIGSAFGQSSSQHKVDTAKSRPNILFILVDDMGWNGPSSYGNLLISTPNIDRLARQGMKFTRFYAQAMCHPSRSELLSGQYGARTGITVQRSHRLYASNYTIAEMLRDAGYATMVSGKWNIAGGYRVAGVVKRHGKQYFKPYGFDYIGNAKEKSWKKIDKDKATPGIVKDFFQFLDHADERPFFAYLAFFSIHTPLQAPDSLVKKYVAHGFPQSDARFGDARQKPTAEYMAMIEFLDHWIGKLLDGLKQRGLAQNTIVVFTSDNGGMNRVWDNSPLRGAKGQLYEGGIRVPLLVRWPGHVPAGSVTKIPVSMLDMYPTFMKVAGGSIPASKVLDGVNLLPLLTQSGGIPRRALYFHRPNYRYDYGHTPSSAIILDDYKLIHFYKDYLDTRGYLPRAKKRYGELITGEKVLLFNLKKDPGERVNLVVKRPKKVRMLLDSLNKWLQRMDASIPTNSSEMNRAK